MPEYARHKIGPAAPEPRTIDRVIPLEGQTPQQIMRILRFRIEQLDKETDCKYALEYSSAPGYDRAEVPIRAGWRWIAVWPVTGGSEGHYLHVEAVYQHDETRKPLDKNEHRAIGLIKLFGGWDAAAELAGIVGRWMDA